MSLEMHDLPHVTAVRAARKVWDAGSEAMSAPMAVTSTWTQLSKLAGQAQNASDAEHWRMAAAHLAAHPDSVARLLEQDGRRRAG